MNDKYLINVPNTLAANEIQNRIIEEFTWNEAGIISYNLPLIATLSACENIMLPLMYSEKMKRGQAQPLVEQLLQKFGMDQTLHYRQKRLNEYEVLLIKFLRAIILCPKYAVFVMPHNMVPSEDYDEFTAFADSLKEFEIIIIEHENFAGAYIKTNFTEILYDQWETRALKTSK